MKSHEFRDGTAVVPSEAAVAAVPVSCPACKSRSISTTARHPDESAYWRCESCGEVWNAARRETRPAGGSRWR